MTHDRSWILPRDVNGTSHNCLTPQQSLARRRGEGHSPNCPQPQLIGLVQPGRNHSPGCGWPHVLWAFAPTCRSCQDQPILPTGQPACCRARANLRSDGPWDPRAAVTRARAGRTWVSRDPGSGGSRRSGRPQGSRWSSPTREEAHPPHRPILPTALLRIKSPPPKCWLGRWFPPQPGEHPPDSWNLRAAVTRARAGSSWVSRGPGSGGLHRSGRPRGSHWSSPTREEAACPATHASPEGLGTV